MYVGLLKRILTQRQYAWMLHRYAHVHTINVCIHIRRLLAYEISNVGPIVKIVQYRHYYVMKYEVCYETSTISPPLGYEISNVLWNIISLLLRYEIFNMLGKEFNTATTTLWNIQCITKIVQCRNYYVLKYSIYCENRQISPLPLYEISSVSWI